MDTTLITLLVINIASSLLHLYSYESYSHFHSYSNVVVIGSFFGMIVSAASVVVSMAFMGSASIVLLSAVFLTGLISVFFFFTVTVSGLKEYG